MRKSLHITSTFDEKYKVYLMAMISSAIQSAGDDFELTFHLFGDGISADTTGTYETFIREKGHAVHWLRDATAGVEIPLTSYFSRVASARLFLADAIDSSVDSVVYLDSDVIVCPGAIHALYETDIGDRALGVVEDFAFTDVNAMAQNIGIYDESYRYFNSGVLIINLKKWRSENATQKHVEILAQKGSSFIYVDQDVLNLCWKDDLHYLPYRFNATSILFAFTQGDILNAPRYDTNEILEAINRPMLLHFYGFLENRPWKTFCFHPKRKLYVKAAKASPYPFVLENTPWRQSADYTKLYLLRLKNTRLGVIPFRLFLKCKEYLRQLRGVR